MRKLTNKQIVNEAYGSVKDHLGRNIPPPPTNTDGTFKTVDQLVSERRQKDYNAQQAQRKAYEAAVKKTEDASRKEWSSGTNNNAYDSGEERKKNLKTILLAAILSGTAFCILTQIFPLFK